MVRIISVSQWLKIFRSHRLAFSHTHSAFTFCTKSRL